MNTYQKQVQRMAERLAWALPVLLLAALGTVVWGLLS